MQKDNSEFPLNKINKANIINENNLYRKKENNQYLEKELFPIEENKYDMNELIPRSIILNEKEKKQSENLNEEDTKIKVLNKFNKENKEINESSKKFCCNEIDEININ